MEITYRNRFLDIVWFEYYLTFRARRVQIVFAIFLVYVGYTLFDIVNHTDLSVLGKVITVIVILAIFLLFLMALQFAYLGLQQIFSSHQQLQTKHDCKLSVSKNGVTIESATMSSEIKWPGIVNLKRSKNFILFFISERAACIVPSRAFANNTDMDNFFSYSHQLWESEKNVIVQK